MSGTTGRVPLGVLDVNCVPNLPNEKKRFRPNHTRGEDAYVWVRQDEEVHGSMADGRVHLRKTTGLYFVRDVASKSPPSEIHQCHSHQRDGVTKKEKLCPFKAKIVQPKGEDGKFEIYFQAGVEHASEVKAKSRGIDPKYIDKVDALLEVNKGNPAFVHNQFVLSGEFKYETMEGGHNKKDLPSTEQCKGRCKIQKNKGNLLTEFSTKADTDAYAAQMTRVTSLDEILALSPLELFLLPDGYYWYEKTGAMFVVSCRAVIENVLWDYKANGQTGDVGVKADGTHGQETDGYTTIDMGNDSLVLDKPHLWVEFNGANKPRMSYRPYLYVTAKAESKIAYELPLRCIIAYAKLAWGININFKGAVGDNMRSLTSAVKMINPEVLTGGTRRCSRKVCQLFSGWTPRIALASTGACRILSHLA